MRKKGNAKKNFDDLDQLFSIDKCLGGTNINNHVQDTLISY